jgi:uncharacterized protein (TIGR03083 family)
VHAERRALVAELGDLDDEQWRIPSLCPGWDVHDVVAHLVDTALTSRLQFVREMLRARGDFDRANARGVARERRPDPRETLAALDAVVPLTRTPPAAVATRLVEAIVHGEDIRRPLGLHRDYPPEATVQALAYQLRTPATFGGGRERAHDLRLVDVDTGTSWGSGRRVEGRALDLLLAVSGRMIEPSSLMGPGREVLVNRIS